MLKEFTVQEETGLAVVIFEAQEGASREVADYFRELSLNYQDYTSGRLPWPTRPVGLKAVFKARGTKEDALDHVDLGATTDLNAPGGELHEALYSSDLSQ
jgi:hypothetical protein